MSQALQVVKPTETAIAVPVSFDAMQQMAESIAKSGLFADINTPDKAMTLMLLCQSEGLHPVSALRRYHIIKGRPAMKADAMLADFQRQGGKVAWVKSDETEARCSFSHPSGGTVEFAFTFAEAKRAGLTANPSWERYPAAMLRARCVSGGIRMVLPGVVAGIYTPEEVEDFEHTPSPTATAFVTRTAPPESNAPINPAFDGPVISPSAFARPVAATPPPSPSWVGLLAEVRKKDGQKNGNPYTLYTILGGDETTFKTFDLHLAEAAKGFAGTGEEVVVEYEDGKYGKTAKAVSAVEQPPVDL